VPQQPANRPLSPAGSAQAQVLGKWVQGDRPAFTLGRGRYEGGKWIEITYGRPLKRERDLFGSGADYGKAGQRRRHARAARRRPCGARARTSPRRINTEVPLIIGDKDGAGRRVQPVHRSEKPAGMDLIVSAWPVQAKFDPKDKTALWGAYFYTNEKDVARIAMKVETLPHSVEELTWAFLDMTNDSGRIALMWDKTLASAPFKAESVARSAGSK
jgi:hypothetical protein